MSSLAGGEGGKGGGGGGRQGVRPPASCKRSGSGEASAALGVRRGWQRRKNEGRQAAAAAPARRHRRSHEQLQDPCAEGQRQGTEGQRLRTCGTKKSAGFTYTSLEAE